MANIDRKKKPETRPMTEEEVALMQKRAHEAKVAQARARSAARAQEAARAKALARAKANARIREASGEEGSGEALPAIEEELLVQDPSAAEGESVAEPASTPDPATAVPTEETEQSPTPVPRVRGEDELEYAIEIHDLHKSYGPKQVLKGLSLNVYPGELFGFIGRNGIGKSTTIDCMIGAKRFNSGSITVGGYDIKHETVDAKFSYGYVASEPTCYEVMTGYDYLEFVASIYGLTETEFTGNFRYLCNRLQLNLSELSHHISGYSHGMKQKLCLVASLMHNPNIWILDEPTVGLDIMAQEELKKMMREYANHGKTVFVTSHNIELVSAICDRVAIINDGVVKVVYDLVNEPEKREQLPRLFLEIYGG
ncbi:MAG: ABC transporter ATP-binding protein [Clostridia bacterium]|nr:ABC transporter ATP-binding protein [Clostridia bacterium]